MGGSRAADTPLPCRAERPFGFCIDAPRTNFTGARTQRASPPAANGSGQTQPGDIVNDEINPEITGHFEELTTSNEYTESQPVHQLPMALGRFTLMKRLGVGGMAEVFLAQSDGSDDLPSTVVVKRMLPHISQNPRSVEMFEREAQIAIRFDHPHLVRTFELGDHPTGKYMVLEFVDGMNVRTLAEALRQRDEPIPVDVVAQILSDAARGLHHFHETPDSEGNVGAFVHRDISPDNLMISRDGVTKILDFGVARPGQDMKMTTTGEVKGKLAYMPPEQIESETLDGRADLYALGASAFWLLSGTRPYDRPQEHLVVLAALTEPVPSLRERVPSCPPEFDEVITRLLAKKREDRYENGIELYEALQPFLQHDTRERASKITRSVHAELMAAKERESTIRAAERTPNTGVRKTQPLITTPPLEHTLGPANGAVPPSRAPIWGASALVAGALVFVGLQLRPTESATIVSGPTSDPLARVPAATVPVEPVQAPVAAVEPSAERAPGGDTVLPTPSAPPAAVIPAASPVAASTPEDNGPAESDSNPEPVVEAKAQSGVRSRVKGPNSVRWYTTRGKKLGSGEQNVWLPPGTKTLVAKDSATDGVHQVSVRDGVADFANLKSGTLEIRALPYADVYIGKQKMGRTPQKLRLPEGKYKVRLVYEAKEATKDIRISANRTQRIKERMK